MSKGRFASFYNGSTNFATSGDTSGNGAFNSKQGMISMWFRTDGLSGEDRYFFDTTNGTVQGFLDAENKVRFIMKSNPTPSSLVGFDVQSTTVFAVGDGAWHHVLLSWDLTSGVDRVQLFINGDDETNLLVGPTNVMVGWVVSDMSLGARVDGSKKFFGW